MIVHNLRIIDKYIKKHRTAKKHIEVWLSFVRKADWSRYEDVKKEYPNLSRIDQYRVVFKVGGNNWRIDVEIDYLRGFVFIKRIGTHEEYNKWKFET